MSSWLFLLEGKPPRGLYLMKKDVHLETLH